jgi:C-terminal processing protease CtpA/Prc
LRKLAPLLLLSIIWLAIGWFASDLLTARRDTISLSAEQELVAKAQQILQQRYLPATELAATEPITAALVDAAIGGMLSWGGDRYADLYGPIASKRFLAGYDDNIGITNLRFDIIDGEKIVTEVPPNSAAAQAGIQVGDILLGTNEAHLHSSRVVMRRGFYCVAQQILSMS